MKAKFEHSTKLNDIMHTRLGNEQKKEKASTQKETSYVISHNGWPKDVQPPSCHVKLAGPYRNKQSSSPLCESG